MLISRKKDRDRNGVIIMEGSEVKHEESLNLLGLNISTDGGVTEHLMSKAKTAGKLVSMLRRNRMFLSANARKQVYIACIRPIMEYACPLFVNSSGYALRALDRVEARARRLFPSVNMDPLSLRRDVAGLCVLYAIVHQHVPTLVQENIPIVPLPVTRTTRLSESTNLAALKIPKSRTVAHNNSFLPYFTRLWNTLANETVFARDSQDFKRRACLELRTRGRSPAIKVPQQ
jgi:hypothetical protein